MATPTAPETFTVTVQSASADAAWVTDRKGNQLLLLAAESPQNRRLKPGDALVVTEIKDVTGLVLTAAAPEIPVSILHGLVPELREGIIQVMGVARAPGVRTKIAVATTDPETDPRLACVGKGGSRVAALSAALGGEKVEIVLYKPDLLEYAKSALEPAKSTSARHGEATDGDEERSIIIEVPDHSKAAAIGDHGLNARLASELVGTRIRVNIN